MNASPFIRLTLLIVSVCSTTGVLAQDNIILKNGSEIQAKVLEVAPGQIKYRRQDNPDGPIYTTGTGDVLLIRYANGTKDIMGQSAPGVASPVNPTSVTTGSAAISRLSYHSGLFSQYFTDRTGTRLDRSVARLMLAAQPDAMQAYRHGQTLRGWSYGTAGAALVLFGTGAVLALTGENEPENDRRFGRDATSTAGENDRRDEHDGAVVGAALAGGGVLLGLTSAYLRHRATVQFRRAADRYNQHLPATSLYIGPSSRGLGIGLTYSF